MSSEVRAALQELFIEFFDRIRNALIFRKRDKCSHDTECLDIENVYQHHMQYQDLNTVKYGCLDPF